MGTFSASDLLGCTSEMLREWSTLPVMDFFLRVSMAQKFGMGAAVQAKPSECEKYSKPLVTCHMETPLAEVMSRALTKHVHRIWVVDSQGLLTGVVSYSDMIRVSHNYFVQHSSNTASQ